MNASGQVARTDLDSAYTDEDMYDFEFAYPAASFRELETHGGDDVVIHASGPGAALFRSVHDQVSSCLEISKVGEAKFLSCFFFCTYLYYSRTSPT